MVEKSFNMLNMKPQLVLYTNGVNENNDWPSSLSKQSDTEIQAVAPRMNNRKIFKRVARDHLKNLKKTIPFYTASLDKQRTKREIELNVAKYQF